MVISNQMTLQILRLITKNRNPNLLISKFIMTGTTKMKYIMWLNNFNQNGQNLKPIKKPSTKNLDPLSSKTTQKYANDKEPSRNLPTEKSPYYLLRATTKFNKLIFN